MLNYLVLKILNFYNFLLVQFNEKGSNRKRLVAADESKPKTICFRPGSEQNVTELTARFRLQRTDHMISIDTNCTNFENGGNKNPLLLLCGSEKYQNSLPCQCPAPNQLLQTSTKVKITNNQQQMICARNYSQNDVDAFARLLIPKELDTEINSSNRLLTIFQFYSQNNLFSLVEQLISDDPTAITNGKDALIWLCKDSLSDEIVEVAELLIDHGIEVNHTYKLLNYNALMSLCMWSKSDKIVEMGKLLIEKGTDLNQKDWTGRNALMWLCVSSTEKIVQMTKLLIENGIDTRQKDRQGMNALMWLCKESVSNKIVEVVKLLIANGIDVNHADKFGNNAMITLCKNSRNEKILEVARLLITKGIDVNQQDKDGKTAVDYLNMRTADQVIKKSEILALLIRNNAGKN